LFKIVIIGDSGVGKSCLLIRFADETFVENYLTTIGVDFRFRTLKINNTEIKLQIVKVTQWDTAGQERFRTITSSYYRGADGILIVFDKTNKQSFEHIDDWMEEVNKYAHTNSVKLLIGNKCDMKEAVDSKTALKKAEKHGVPYIETSAKTSSEVDQAFQKIAEKLLERRLEQSSRSPGTVKIDLRPKQQTQSNCCS